MSYTLQETDLSMFNEGSGELFTGFFADRGIVTHVNRTLRDENGSEHETIAALSRDQRMYLVGEPGEGKSTIVAKTGEDIALGRVQGIDSAMFVPLHALEDSSSADSIVDWIATKGPAVSLGSDFVSAMLHRPETALLLDGLDEIADQERREDLSSGLNGLIERFPEARYLMLSSRPWIEKPVVTGRGFSRYVISPELS
jgi:predicted NACHT family NTPase